MESIREIVGIVILFFYWIVIPSAVGVAGARVLFSRTREIVFAEAYIWGNIILWAIFQMLCVPMGMLGIKFSILSIMYMGIIFILLVCLFIISFKYQRWFEIPLYSIKKIQWGVWLVILLILGQIFFFVFGAAPAHVGGDDSSYIATALDAVENNEIAAIDPYTGQKADKASLIKLALTSWNYYVSFLSEISGIHVAAVAHTFLPVMLVPMAFVVYWLIARFLFCNDKKKVCIFLLCLNLLLFFGAYSRYTLTFRLDMCVWQGKAVMAIIMLPFLFYYLIRVEEYGKKEVLCILLIIAATCAMSLMGVGLTIVIVIGAFVAKYRKEDTKKYIPLLLVAAIVLSLSIVLFFARFNGAEKLSIENIKNLYPAAMAMARDANGLYWGGSYLQWLYYGCLVFLLLKKNRCDKKDKFFRRYVIWQYLLIFNPIFCYIAYIFLGGPNVYVRLYYTLFPELYMSYILTVLLFALKRKRIQICCAFAGVVIIIGLGKPYWRDADYGRAENAYKIPQEVVELCDMINEDSKETLPKVVVGDDAVIYIRQYSSRIRMLYGRYGYSYNGYNILDLIRSNDVSIEEIVHLMEENDCQYLVWRREQSDVEELERLGGSVIGSTDSYVVYRRNKEEGKF